MEQEFDRYLIIAEGVAKTDESGEIVGEYHVGTIQKLPVEYGDWLVEKGLAEVVEAPALSV